MSAYKPEPGQSSPANTAAATAPPAVGKQPLVPKLSMPGAGNATPGLGQQRDASNAPSDWVAVWEWTTENRLEVSLTPTMQTLVARVRKDVGSRRPGLAAANEQAIAAHIRDACHALGIPLGPESSRSAPAAACSDALRSALSRFPSAQASVTVENGQVHAVLLGDTPKLGERGVQLQLDPSGLSLHEKGQHVDLTLQLTAGLGFVFATTVGSWTFAAGIDGQHWQLGMSFGPDTPDLEAIATIFTNAYAALTKAVRTVAGKPYANPVDTYKTAISPNLESIKAAISAARDIAKVEPGISFGLSATGSVGAGATGTSKAPPVAPVAMPLSIKAVLNVSF